MPVIEQCRQTAPRPRPGRRGLRPLWTTPGDENSSARLTRPTAALLALVLGACAPAPDRPHGAADDTGCLPGEGPSLQGRLYGSVEAPLAWRGAELDCEGMPRPADGGIRLRFAKRIVPTDESLVIIVGIAGIGPGEAVQGRQATLTIIDERNDRFFSNAGDNCWADVLGQDPLPRPANAYAIDGRVYCTAALAEVGGGGGVSLDELEFRGRVDWPGADGSTP